MTTTARPTPVRPARRPRRATRLDRAVARLLRALERPEAPYLVLLAAFIAVGAYLRLDRLGAQSLWFDEADVVMQAQASFGALLGDLGAAGQNGPLYTLFLHVWTALFGTSEVVVRLPSVLAGVATIPLLYLTGRALHGPKLGLYAAGIATVAPYQQWYAQEAKMYALVVGATLASTYLLLRALRDDRPRSWVAYVVVTTLALYLHVTAALVMVAQMAYVVLTRWRRPGTRRGWLALAALTLPYLPLGIWELRFIRADVVTWHRPIGLLDFLRVSFTKFAVNRADPATETRGSILFGALALLGLLPVAWRHAPWPAPPFPPRRRALLLGLLLGLPLALFYAVTLLHPLFSDRYLIVVTPAFILLVAGGLLALERYARVLTPLALVALLATSWVPLRDVNLARAPQKEQWREAYTYIAAHLHPRDVVIVHPGYLVTTFDYYRLQQPPGSRLRDAAVVTLPADYTNGVYDERRLDLFLQQQTTGYERVWLVLSTDPTRLAAVDPGDRLRAWYRYNGRLTDELTLNGVWVGLYVYNRPFGAPYYPPVPARLDAGFAGNVTLVGYGYDFFPDQSAVAPGGSIPLILRWLFPNPMAGPFTLRWQLLDERGNAVAAGAEPLLGNHPLRPWKPGDEVWDYHDLTVPASLPPGAYRLAIALAPTTAPETLLPATRNGAPLPGNVVPLGWITVR